LESAIALSQRFDGKLTTDQAALLQAQLAREVICENRLGPVRTIAGADAAVKGNWIRAAVVVLRWPDLTLLESRTATRPIEFPYIPGLLSLREMPSILEALAKLDAPPDLLIIDGQGIAHPRRLGMASHLGLVTDLPTIGCAKTKLCGRYQEPAPARGSASPLVDGHEVIGRVLRTRSAVKPLFVSIGHRVDLETAQRFVLGCCTRYRLPQTTRLAHHLAEDWKDQSVNKEVMDAELRVLQDR
jgi:deoxyribonuclease V